MNSQKTRELYERFAHLYRERAAPLAASKMGWGFQCEDGWYKIIYEMSKKIEKISGHGEHSAAIAEVCRHDDGTLAVQASNLTPPVADIITGAREQSRITCEFCSYSPAFLRASGQNLEGHIACGRCVAKTSGKTKRKGPRQEKKPRRVPDTLVIKR